MTTTFVNIELFTIGYEGRSVDELLGDLVQAGIERLVDVRELPLSRKRGFSKTALGEALAGQHIEYRHIRPLGNPKENRDRYRAGDIEGGAEVYRQRLQNGSRQSLLALSGELDQARICLLCFERDHQICHRDVIVEDLIELDDRITVTHL